MNWQAINFDWNQVRAFLATAEEGTLSAAARALRLTQPTLGRQVTALEETLGVTLFERVGRSLVLTEAGTALLTHVRAMGEAAHRVSLAAAGQNDAVAGDVRISASDALCTYLLPDLLRDLRRKAPGLTIELLADNRVSDLMRREADIAIRHVEPTEPELIGRRMKDGHAKLYAATRWLAENPAPRTVAELAAAPMVGMDDPQAMRAGLARFGVEVPELTVPIRSSNGVVGWELLRAGHGVGLMADAVARRTPGIEEITIDGFDGVRFPIWLITHRELRTSRRIRVVFDFLAEGLNRVI
ncbi:LysR family transcriptional regulator [Rhodobacterales bacterium HKCCE3408]|nr:LysR family transcriptional regulator [Rhodobacterales bacterium HKCCE3408]